MTGDVVDWNTARAARGAALPLTKAKASGEWLFHADFYDATSEQTICHVGHAAPEVGEHSATRMRLYADTLMKAAQAFLRDAELLEPRNGPPLAAAFIQEGGVRVFTSTPALAAADPQGLGKAIRALAHVIGAEKARLTCQD